MPRVSFYAECFATEASITKENTILLSIVYASYPRLLGAQQILLASWARRFCISML
jgi:hypothetical protein